MRVRFALCLHVFFSGDVLTHLSDKEKDSNVVVLYEAAVAECFVCYERQHREQMLVEEAHKLEEILHWRRVNLGKERGEESAALDSKTSALRKRDVVRRITQEGQRMQERLARHREAARTRIAARGYDSPTMAALEQRWSNCEDRIGSARDALKTTIEQWLDAESTEAAGYRTEEHREDNAAPDSFIPDFSEFTQRARSAVAAISDPVLRAMMEGEFKNVEERLLESQFRVQQRLRYEHRVMEEWVKNMKDDRYERFLRNLQSVNFASLPTSLFAQLAPIKHSEIVRLSRDVMKCGSAVVADALGWNRVVSCVDCHACSLDEVITILSPSWKAKSVSLIVSKSLAESEVDRQRLEEALRGRKNILALSYIDSSMDIPHTWKQAIAQNRKDASEHRADEGPLKLVFYEYAYVSIIGAKGYSYLGFFLDSRSSCTVLFSVPATGTAHGAGAGQLTLRMGHRLGEQWASSMRLVVTLNAAVVQWEEDKCSGIGDDFAVQDIVLPSNALKPANTGVNELTITFISGWGYHLRDVPQLMWRDESGRETVW